MIIFLALIFIGTCLPNFLFKVPNVIEAFKAPPILSKLEKQHPDQIAFCMEDFLSISPNVIDYEFKKSSIHNDLKISYIITYQNNSQANIDLRLIFHNSYSLAKLFIFSTFSGNARFKRMSYLDNIYGDFTWNVARPYGFLHTIILFSNMILYVGYDEIDSTGKLDNNLSHILQNNEDNIIRTMKIIESCNKRSPEIEYVSNIEPSIVKSEAKIEFMRNRLKKIGPHFGPKNTLNDIMLQYSVHDWNYSGYHFRDPPIGIHSHSPMNPTGYKRVAINRGSEMESRIVSLLQQGADPNYQNKWGYNSLHIAGENERISYSVIDLLLSKGANIEANDYAGNTPLHVAVLNKNHLVSSYLIAKGADINAINNYGQTPLHLAVLSLNRKLAFNLLKNGADMEAKDDQGMAPIHYAALIGAWNVTGLLITNGAELNAKDYEGKTPLVIAEEAGQEKFSKLFRKNGGQE